MWLKATNIYYFTVFVGFPGGSVVKNLPPARQETLEMLVCSLIPGTEEPGGLQSVGLQSQTQLSTHTHSFCGPGIQEGLSWVGLEQGLSGVTVKLLARTAVISRLDWV